MAHPGGLRSAGVPAWVAPVRPARRAAPRGAGASSSRTGDGGDATGGVQRRRGCPGCTNRLTLSPRTKNRAPHGGRRPHEPGIGHDAGKTGVVAHNVEGARPCGRPRAPSRCRPVRPSPTRWDREGRDAKEACTASTCIKRRATRDGARSHLAAPPAGGSRHPQGSSSSRSRSAPGAVPPRPAEGVEHVRGLRRWRRGDHRRGMHPSPPTGTVWRGDRPMPA